MKRFLVIVAIVFLLTPSALADEILFRGIPWYSSFSDVQASFGEDVPVGGVDGINMYLVADMKGDFANIYSASVANVNYPSGWMGIAPLEWYDFKVAGHPVDALYVLCAYGIKDGVALTDADSSQLYAAAYQFSAEEDTYLDLQTKLKSLYGSGEETIHDYTFSTINNETTIRHSTRWNGDNGTSAVLTWAAYKNSEGNYYYSNVWLTYSIAGADDVIRELAPGGKYTAAPDDVSGL